jgi:hypothetical protein
MFAFPCKVAISSKSQFYNNTAKWMFITVWSRSSNKCTAVWKYIKIIHISRCKMYEKDDCYNTTKLECNEFMAITKLFLNSADRLLIYFLLQKHYGFKKVFFFDPLKFHTHVIDLCCSDWYYSFYKDYRLTRAHGYTSYVIGCSTVVSQSPHEPYIFIR